MIFVNTEGALPFADPSSLGEDVHRAERALQQVQSAGGRGSEWLGWRRILAAPDQEELLRTEQAAGRIRSHCDLFIVCGIGGSYLGAKAVIRALRDHFPGEGPEILFAGHHVGGRYLEQLLRYLERPAPDGRPREVCLNVISKSGTTLETAVAFRTLRNWMERRYGEEETARRIVATTGTGSGVLAALAAKKGYETFSIPEDVGGRFSVLTPVGLLPIAVAGIDIRSLLQGARSLYRQCEEPGSGMVRQLLEYAALRARFHDEGKTIDVIGSFEPELEDLGGWIQQLYGESEGKEGKGLFPVAASWSTDLHSIGQMVQEGRRNLIETFITVREPTSQLRVEPGPEGGGDPDGLSFLDGLTFHEINRQALAGTKEAHREGGVPVFEVAIQRLDEENLGGLLYFFQLFTAVYGYMLGINPFDQPGVEAYKRYMYRNLGKD